MRAAARLEAWTGQPRLFERRQPPPPSLWTETVAEQPPVYGERLIARGDRTYRRWEPGRSKLAAALTKERRLRPPKVGERWLYLGAANGTTASHIADLVGPDGGVYAVERSPRTFVRLLARSEQVPNLWPILADARSPGELDGLVGEVEGIYCDVAQPDQAAIVSASAAARLAVGGRLLFAVKLASLAREIPMALRAPTVQRELAAEFDWESAVDLAPFHRQHVLLSGAYRGPEGAGRRVSNPPRARLMPSRAPPAESPPSRYPRRRGGAPSRRSGPESERSGPRPWRP